MGGTNVWQRMIENDPDHSRRYAQRWRDLAAAGEDINGEARLIDAMLPRRSSVLDAGCGTGRVGGYLLDAGHDVTGVDLDPFLIEVAQQDHPNGRWYQGDLATFEFPEGERDSFDVIVSAGNVMGFLAQDNRGQTLKNLARFLNPAGRLVIGYGAGRGYEFGDFLSDAAAAGLKVQQAYSSWELQPFDENSDFLVAVLVRN
ncbi:class I SAM-dependent methyltransferase [Micrococcoides hystricis]|uniref:Class I SAM-dependent methyltransferase n=1 Tax=Micrococcoides hystricis TaxID=1572761 RepID=A0ABV6P8Z4_9MICC